VRVGVVPNNGQLPVEVVRDLLGLARALYSAFVEMGPAYDDHRFKLRGIGVQLQLALDKAKQGGPGTFAMRTAWLIAEQAAADLGAMVDKYMPAKVMIDGVGKRLAKKNR
jgi:hypothetical protein